VPSGRIEIILIRDLKVTASPEEDLYVPDIDIISTM
jgi:hypothetical protein